MPSLYIQSADYATYGLPGATTAAQVTQASALIDAYLYRPEGLLWAPDGTGAPCYMSGLAPTFTMTAAAGVSAGANVVAPLTGPASMLQAGDVLVLDRATPSLTEACVIASITGNTATLKNVLFSHAPNVTLDAGLLIEEQRSLSEYRPITFASKTPLQRVVSGTGRYAYGRRGSADNFNMDQFNLLAAVSQFGGPPIWEVFSASNVGIDSPTGQVWIPAGVMLAYYSEVKLRYVAGFQYANLPSAVKLACAGLVQALTNNLALGAIKSYKAGDTAIEKFIDSVIDSDTRHSLNPYRARLFI